MWSTLRPPWSRWASRLALVPERGKPTTYQELDGLVGRAADCLTSAGVGTGTTIAVAMPAGADLVVTVLGGLACGAKVALLNTQWWPRELRAAFEVAGGDLVLTHPDLAPMARDLAPVAVVPPVGRDGEPAWLTLTPKTVVTMVGRVAAQRGTPGAPGASRAEPRAQGPGPGVSGLTCFTAGVWGEPRPVLFSHQQLADHWAQPDDGPPETTLLAGDACTAAGLRLVAAILAGGGTVALTERWAPLRTARRLARGGIDRLWATGPQLNQLANLVRPETRWPALARIYAVGGVLHRRAAVGLASTSGAQVSTTLTVTEAGGPVSYRQPGPAARHHPLDVGMPTAAVSVDIVDDGGIPAAPGQVGHLRLSGPGLGITGRPAAGATTTSPSAHERGVTAPYSGRHNELCDGMRTSDLGRIGTEGNLHLLGRAGDLFECNGELVWPALVELVLAGHPGIADVAVVPRPDPEVGYVPVAVTVPVDPEVPPFLVDLAPRLAELPQAWRPRAQAVVERLPLTGSGQVHRRMLVYDEAAR